MTTPWPICRLQELAAPHKGAMAGGPFGSDLVSSDYVDEGVPVIRGTNLPFNERISFDNLVFVTEAKADALHLNCAYPGDLVFTQRGTLGQVGLLPSHPTFSRYLISQSQMKMTVDHTKADPLFLYYYFRLSSSVSYIENHALQSGVPHINLSILRKLAVITPPLDAQRKVAAILTAYDDLIAINQRRIALLEAMAEEIYREWFVRMRFPGYADTYFSKGRPANWLPATLNTICKFTMGQSPSSEFYNAVGNGLPFHQGVGTYGARFPMHEVFCSVPGRTAKAGDILFSVRAPVGRLNIADQDLILGRGLASMRHVHGANTYLYYLLKTTFSDEDMIGNGSIFKSVGKDELERFPLISPPSALVNLFEERVRPIDQQLNVLHRQVASLQKTRDSLLPRLISGKLRVDHLDIQLPPSMRAEQAERAQHPT